MSFSVRNLSLLLFFLSIFALQKYSSEEGEASLAFDEIDKKKFYELKKEKGLKVVISCTDDHRNCYNNEEVYKNIDEDVKKGMKIYYMKFDPNENGNVDEDTFMITLPTIFLIGDNKLVYKRDKISKDRISDVTKGIFRKWVSDKKPVYTQKEFLEIQKDLKKEFEFVGIFRDSDKNVDKTLEIIEKLKENEEKVLLNFYFLVIADPKMNPNNKTKFKLTTDVFRTRTVTYKEKKPLSEEIVIEFIKENMLPLFVNMNSNSLISISTYPRNLVLPLLSGSKLSKLKKLLLKNKKLIKKDYIVLLFPQEAIEKVKERFEFGKDEEMVMFENLDNKKYIFKEEFTEEKFKKYIEDMIKGKVEEFIHSEKIPDEKENKGPIYKIVAKNFDEKIKEKKNALIIIVSRNCQNCSKFYDEILFLHNLLVDKKSLTIYEFDVSRNQPSKKFVVKRVPQLISVDNSNKEEVISMLEENEYNAKTALDFIKENFPNIKFLENAETLIKEREELKKKEEEEDDVELENEKIENAEEKTKNEEEPVKNGNEKHEL